MFRPDGTQPVPMGYTGGGAIYVPWGVNINGNGDVWVGNTNGRSVVLLAGDETKRHPVGMGREQLEFRRCGDGSEIRPYLP
jgi:hypothetical protein